MRVVFSKAAFLFLSSLLLLAPGLSQAWWSDDWSYRKKITIDTSQAGANIGEELFSVPVLIRLHTGNFDFLNAKDDGTDIRFVSGDDKTPLKYHIEKYDGLNELALIWVRVPKLAASAANDIWLYYGNGKAADGGDAQGTYDVDHAAVYHFGDAAGAPQDATAYGNHATTSSAGAAADAVIGGGAGFNGSARITLPASPSLVFGKGFTFSAWIKFAAPRDAVIFSAQGGGASLVIGIDQANSVYARLGDKEIPRGVALSPGAWHHLAVTAGQRLIVYVDGVEAGAVDVSSPVPNGQITLGAAGDGSKGFIGEMDEAQISGIVRSAAWLRAAALGEGAGSKMIVYGGEEGGGEESASYFNTILQSVTLDGWVVIAILAVMAAISWIVMVGKAMVISRAARDNNKFMRSFRRLASDPGVLDQDEEGGDESGIEESPFATALFGPHDHYQSSPIYRIYHVGMQEIKHRFGNTDPVAVGKVLSPQNLGAIRASLDAALVRENQKLNKQMVLLTIAISGGPFLGLLGTVVGVMITFAAIAATGDVNINAIAPGIAAALVATVAGLAVAIPALFGYNYLISRIKNLTADMHVFVDEFVHKVAENYGA